MTVKLNDTGMNKYFTLFMWMELIIQTRILKTHILWVVLSVSLSYVENVYL